MPQIESVYRCGAGEALGVAGSACQEVLPGTYVAGSSIGEEL